jgi:hypothetical protein
MTVRDLVTKIDRSDVLVYLIGSNEPGNWRGKTRFVSAAAGARMLIVTINLALESPERIAVLGHELQHVHEVAEAPEVVDLEGFRRFFARTGDQISLAGNEFETVAAQAIERRVLQEVTRVRLSGAGR